MAAILLTIAPGPQAVFPRLEKDDSKTLLAGGKQENIRCAERVLYLGILQAA